MTKGIRRLTALLMALAISVSMLPGGAFASAPNADAEIDDTVAAVAETKQTSDVPEERAASEPDPDPEPEPEPEEEPESEPEPEPEPEIQEETPEEPGEPEADSAPEAEPEVQEDEAEEDPQPVAEKPAAAKITVAEKPAVKKETAAAKNTGKVSQVSAPAAYYYNFDNDTLLDDAYEEEESPELAGVAPNVKVTYGQSGAVKAGTIRYVSQNPNGTHYHPAYWSQPGDKTKVLCSSANVSMMLSYLGINRLPKNLGRDSVCKEKEWDGAIPSTGMSFYKAMDNYLNGGGLFSPPMIRLVHDAYMTKQHFVIVIRQTGMGSYEALDPFNRGFYMDTGIWPMLTEGVNITQFYKKNNPHSTKFNDVYQFHREQETRLVGANQPGNMTQGTRFTPAGKLYGSKDIVSVQVGCLDMLGKKQTGCFQMAKPNSVGYDLSKLNGALRFDLLKPGFYRYQVKATTADGVTKTYLTRDFTVLAKVRTVENATFYLDNSCNIKYCVGPKNKSSENTAQIIITRNTENALSRFEAKHVGNGYYTLRDVGSGKYLTVYRSKNVPGTHLIQYKMVNRPGQFWQILPNGKGRYYLVPKCAPGCCLTLTNSAVKEGNPLSIQKAAQATAQTWLMRPTRARIHRMVNTSKGIQVTWDAPPSASGYIMFRKKNKETKWVKLRTVSSGKTHTLTDTGVKNGVNYHYKVTTKYGKKTQSPTSPEKQFYRLSAPRVRKPVSTKRGTIKAAWNKSKTATHYQIRYSRGKGRGMSKPIQVSGKTFTKMLTQMARGRVYYLQVRAIRAVTGGIFFSTWSPQVSVRVHR